MSYFEKIHTLRQKPYAYKKRIAMILSISITAVIFLVWLGFQVVSMSSPTVTNGQVSEQHKSPFAFLQEQFSAFFSNERSTSSPSAKELLSNVAGVPFIQNAPSSDSLNATSTNDTSSSTSQGSSSTDSLVQ